MVRLQKIKRMRRRKAVALVVGAAVSCLVAASAASLGGVSPDTIGTDAVTVASCDTDGVDVSYTTGYDASVGRYQTTAVTVSSIDAACNGNAISVTVSDAADAALGTATGTVGGTSQVLTFAGIGVNANLIEGVAVLISG